MTLFVSAAGTIAAAIVYAATQITWVGVAALVVFAVLIAEVGRRVGKVLAGMDDVNDKLDAQKQAVDAIRALITDDAE